MRSIYSTFHEWDDKPSPIDTRYMKGEGYQVSCPDELDPYGEWASELEDWAKAWLKRMGFAVREEVMGFKRDDGAKLCIMVVDWKREALRAA